ncbi:MAG: ATP-dependent Clp protease adaptor ClpS [Spirochaetaceae bacterium]|jgi:ATP-dependent Clp protease adaptor protein ClpS|nr:ATP-dependent Clp protease adaptor ClpS [Spirochaetaceae bacterium]
MSNSFEDQFEGSVLEDQKVEEPSMYRVILLNDDYTPQDFVVKILISIFHKSPIESSQIMLDVHKKGKAGVGIYTYDIATTKIDQVSREARKEGFPLRSVLEKI